MFTQQITADYFFKELESFKTQLIKDSDFVPQEAVGRYFARHYRVFSSSEAQDFHKEVLRTGSDAIYSGYFGALVSYQTVRSEKKVPLLPLCFDKIETHPLSYFLSLLENTGYPIPPELIEHYLKTYFKETVLPLHAIDKYELFYAHILKQSVDSWLSIDWIMNAPYWSEKDKVSAFLETCLKQSSNFDKSCQTLLKVGELCENSQEKEKLYQGLNTVFDTASLLKLVRNYPNTPTLEDKINFPSILYLYPDIYQVIEKKEPLFFQELHNKNFYHSYTKNNEPKYASFQETVYLTLNGIQYVYLNQLLNNFKTVDTLNGFFKRFSKELNEAIKSTSGLIEKNISLFEAITELRYTQALYSVDISYLNEENQKYCVALAVIEFLHEGDSAHMLGEKEQQENMRFLKNLLYSAPTLILEKIIDNSTLLAFTQNPERKEELKIIAQRKKIKEHIGMPSPELGLSSKSFKI